MLDRHWLKWALAAMVTLTGCGGSETPESPAGAPSGNTIQESPTVQESPQSATDEADPLLVAFSLSAQLRTDRRLSVEGQTNLPDDARLQVVVVREASGVRWQARTKVEQGSFSAGPFGPGSGLPDGGYRISVHLSEATVQPEEVQQRIGRQGQHLAGELVSVSRHGLGQVATYSQRYLIGNEPREAQADARVLERP